MKNLSLEKAIALLVHPLSLAALAGMLLNDAVLRRLAPSWITGKLSDLAFLMVAPFVAAAIIALLLPLKEPTRQQWTGALAFALTGLGFALVKAVPAAHGLAESLLARLPVPLSTRIDPSDLLALAGLLPAIWMWTHAPLRIPSKAALAAFPFTMLLLLADAAAPNYGVSCLSTGNGLVFAGGVYDAYQSSDGGLTWTYAQQSNSVRGCRPGVSPNGAAEQGSDWRVVQDDKTGVTFRYRSGYDIQMKRASSDSWTTAYAVKPLSEADQAYLIKTQAGNPYYIEGPLNAAADPKTGNMIFAMGYEGVLVDEPSGQWIWSAVGSYSHRSGPPGVDFLSTLLWGEALLSVYAGLLVFTLCSYRFITASKWVKVIFWVLLVLGILAWLGSATLFAPAIVNSYMQNGTGLGILIVAILSILLAIFTLVFLIRAKGSRLLMRIALAIVTMLLVFLPYLLWGYDVIHAYSWAMLFALVLLAAAAAVGLAYLRQRPDQAVQTT